MTMGETLLRVTSVRSRGRAGGAIFAGKSETGETFAVVAGHALLGDSSLIERAQVWSVAGQVREVTYTVEGVVRTESEIQATHLELRRPSGKNIITWISQSPDCRGIGEVKARRLWERFGEDLLSRIEAGDLNALAEVVGEEPASALVAAFEKHGIAETLLWLDQLGMPRTLASSVANYWGKEARQKVEANPYVLVSFCAEWSTLDKVARTRFGVTEDDRRRLVAAAEEALYRAMGGGDTAVRIPDARTRLTRLLGSREHVDRAIDAAVEDGKAIRADGILQVQGMARIEEAIARGLNARLQGTSEGQSELFVTDMPAAASVEATVALYESMQGIELTTEQQLAVVTSATNQLSLILGGAGTGKTTVLKALCHVIDRLAPGTVIHQLALAGRAAQRMTQSTGRPSKTIAAFLLDDPVAPGCTVLVDEMSMVDVILMYRLLKHLPDDVRLVLIGDPSQLPPIGPGLVLHALAGQLAVPQTTLKTVKRQSAESGIPVVAGSVREHRIPLWAPYTSRGAGVSALRCAESELDEAVLKAYDELGGDGMDYSVQVLSTTREGHGGVRALNALLHARYAPKVTPIRSHSDEFGLVNETTADHLGLFVDDLVMFGTNDYALGLRNGAMGRIVEPCEVDGAESCVCIAEFEGLLFKLTAAHLRHVTHAYAVTIHKSQGSQFERVIVPVRTTRLLDNSLLYTAITRAVQQVALVGDISSAERAIKAPSSSSRRTTRLSMLLEASASSTLLSHTLAS